MARFLSIYFVLLMVSYRDATDGETVPLAPENVRILDEYTTLSSLRVAWDHPTPSPSVEHFYQIRYRTVLSASASMDVGSDATTSTISGLETNTLYVINVLSAVDDEDGYIQFSTILADNTLYGRTGGAQPGDIFLRKLTSYSLECEFEPLQSNVIHYLNFTVGDRSNPSVRSVNDPHSTWAIYGLTPGETYRMVLGADGMTGQEKWVTTIPLPPENVRVVSYTPTTLSIAWDPPAQGTGDSPPIVHSYQVEVFPTDIIVKVNSTVTEVTIEDLHSGSSYGISVKSLAGMAGVNEVKSIGSVIVGETDTDECISNPCGENGECFNVPDLYFCLCYDGWTGFNCTIDINDCVPNPCANGGTCMDGVNTFFCECDAGYTGDLCDGDVDECHSDPCAGNSECHHGIDFYFCICLDGWTGDDCDENIDDCLPDSCDNGGTCKDGVNTVICLCPRGYTGQRCQTDINDCLPDPCLNGGSCDDGLDSFTCNCPEGITGFICETNINDCIPDPCMNGGTCKDEINAYTCECPPGIIGLRCEEEINECESYPCLNGAYCTDGNNAFSCTCLVGFTGQRCQTDINECASHPCLNGGTCNDGIDAFTCNCSAGFLGQRCAEDISKCTSNPCTNGVCLDGANMYYCTCQPGWIGVNCDINFDECSSHPCLNEASCIDKINGFTCICAYGFTGDRCQEDIDECISDPCINGQCFDGRNLFYCICISGWTGVNCEIDINECSSNPCDNGGTCMDEIGRFTCHCPDGVIGQLCEIEDPCNPSPCMNNCSCSVADDNMRAVCTTDSQYIAGEFCEIVHECILNDICENGGTCVPLNDSSKCICPIYFTGDRCEFPWCSAEDVCHGNGNCAVVDGEPTCFCFSSWVGSFCDIDNPCLPVNPCHNSGVCTYDVNESLSSASISCKCDQSWIGDRCEIAVKFCLTGSCNGRGDCSVVSNEIVCDCDPGSVGQFCGIDDPCIPNPCENDCLCNVSDSFEAECISSSSLVSGPLCENVHPCWSSSPCDNGGTCDAVSEFYTCLCLEGFTGDECQTALGCFGPVCSNGGTCQGDPETGDFISCQCTSEYYGSQCENAYPCTLEQCSGRGSCTNILDTPPYDYSCYCSTSFIGRSCQFADPCILDQSPCQNGATCSYTNGWDIAPVVYCSCLPDYTGENCESLIHPCNRSTNPCSNGGSCDPLPEHQYTCICQTGFIGKNCTLGDPCVNIGNLCYNGATCVSAVTGYSATFSCNCAADWTGPRCNEAYPCVSNPCQGNGTCTDHLRITPYNFSCICQSPFIGHTCQYEDPCYANPCLNGGTCSYTGGVSFQPVQECVCSSGFYGELCEDAYPCTSNPCRENGICTNKIQILPYDYECNCTHPYIGRSCQYENPCYENPCQNGATCTYSTDGVTSPPLPECLCPPTHYGELCEKAYPCTSNPCQGRGSCSNIQGEASANNFTCDCSSPYIGLTCQYVNPCSTNPCENNGSCSYVEGISTSPVRTCTCLSLYYGNLCENAYPCASNPCHGKGNCTNNLQSTPYNFICNCNSPHIGLTCQYDDPCHNATCLNGGTCEYTGGSIIPPVKSCLCQDGFIGDVCENAPTTMTSPDQNTIQSGGTTTTSPVLTKEAPATPTDSHPTTQNTGNTATLERTEVTGLETLEPSLSYSPSSAEPTDHPRGTTIDRATPTPTGSFDLLTTVIIINAILVVIIIIGTSVAIGRYCLKKRHKRDNQGKDEPLSGPEAEAAELFAAQRKHGQLMFQRVDSGYVNTVVLEPVSTSYNTGHPTTKSGRQLPPLPLEVELIENEEIYKKHQSEGSYEEVDDGGDSQQGQESDYDSLEPENKIDVDVDSDVVHGGYEPVYEPGLPKDHAYEETIEQSARKHRHEDSIKYENCTAETNHGLTDIKPQAPKGTQNNEFHMVLTVETEC